MERVGLPEFRRKFVEGPLIVPMVFFIVRL
jgi:hypothetical protein